MMGSIWRTWLGNEIRSIYRGGIHLVVRELEDHKFTIHTAEEMPDLYIHETIARGFNVTTYAGISQRAFLSVQKFMQDEWKCETYESAVKTLDDYLVSPRRR